MLRDRGVNVCLANCLNFEKNVKALVGAFNQEKAVVGAFSVIVKTYCETDGSFTALVDIQSIKTNYSLTSADASLTPASSLAWSMAGSGPGPG